MLFATSLADSAKPQLFDIANQIANKFREINTSKIHESMNRFMNSEAFKDFLTVSHNLAYLDYLKRIQWLLFLINDKILEEKLFIIIGSNEESSSTIIMEYYSNEAVSELTKDWNKCDVVQNDRKIILSESVKAYEMQLYTLCVSSLTCQMSGIINDITILYHDYGVEFTEEDLSGYLKLIEETEEHKKLGDLKSEKTKLLGISKDIAEGFYYYASFVLYMRDIIYTSDNIMSSSNHPCRNKICHGDQVTGQESMHLKQF